MNKHKEKYLSGHIKISCYKLMKENLKSHQRCIVFSGEKVEIIPDFTSKKKNTSQRHCNGIFWSPKRKKIISNSTFIKNILQTGR